MLILIADSFDASLPERLKPFGEIATEKSRLSEAEVVLVRSKTKCTQEYIDSAPKLKLIIRGGVGLDNVDAPYAKKKGILVQNTPEASSVTVAELAMALMLAVPNHIVEAHNSMKEGKWLRKNWSAPNSTGRRSASSAWAASAARWPSALEPLK